MARKSTPPAPKRSSNIFRWGVATALFVGIMAASGSGNQPRYSSTPTPETSSTPEIDLPAAEITPPTEPTSARSLPTFRPAATPIGGLPSPTRPASTPTPEATATSGLSIIQTKNASDMERLKSVIQAVPGIGQVDVVTFYPDSEPPIIYAELLQPDSSDLRAIADAILREGLSLAVSASADVTVVFAQPSGCRSYEYNLQTDDWRITELSCTASERASAMFASALPAPTTAPALTAPALLPTISSPYTCNCSKLCSAITTCEEARYQLSQCGCTERDSDDDGVPCESLCPGG